MPRWFSLFSIHFPHTVQLAIEIIGRSPSTFEEQLAQLRFEASEFLARFSFLSDIFDVLVAEEQFLEAAKILQEIPLEGGRYDRVW